MDFSNKVVVITGASSGIGEASAIEFSKRKSSVVLVARRKENLVSVAKNLTKYGNEVLVCQCDVSEWQEVEQMSRTVLDKFGKIDVLVNNAGFAIYGSVLELKVEEIESQMETNYFGMVYAIKAFLPSKRSFSCRKFWPSRHCIVLRIKICYAWILRGFVSRIKRNWYRYYCS